jgi:DNA-binding MarR family transcriptional regulator
LNKDLQETKAPAAGADTARQALELAVRMKLRVLASSSRQKTGTIANNARIGASQLAALVEIGRNPGICVNEFASLQNIKPASASNLIDRLEDRGWVRRERRSADQRIVRLFVTPKGAKALERYPAPSREIVVTALGMIPEEALATLDHHLGELISNLERLVSGGTLASLGDM